METNRNHRDHRDQERRDLNQNTGNLGNRESEPMRAGGRNAGREEEWERDNRSPQERNIDDSRQAQSRTFNEDEETWEEEQRMSGDNGRNWNENDQAQRSPGRDTDEERKMHGRYNDEEQNRYGSENDRRNREELE